MGTKPTIKIGSFSYLNHMLSRSINQDLWLPHYSFFCAFHHSPNSNLCGMTNYNIDPIYKKSNSSTHSFVIKGEIERTLSGVRAALKKVASTLFIDQVLTKGFLARKSRAMYSSTRVVNVKGPGTLGSFLSP